MKSEELKIDSTNKQISFKDIKCSNFKIDKEIKYDKLSFKNVEFECYADFNTLNCKELIIEDCIFNKVGSFKNVQIDKLIFNRQTIKEKLIFTTSKQESYIKNIKSYDDNINEKGKVFFEDIVFEEADFSNNSLEEVVFRNCDLSKVQFLYSDISDTKFQNCTFPKTAKRKNLNEFIKSGLNGYFIIVTIVLIYFLYKLDDFFYYPYPFNETLLIMGGFLSSFMMIFIILGIGNLLATVINYIFFKMMDIESHYSTYDEELIYNKETDEKVQIKKLIALTELYNILQKSFQEKGEIQKSGDFFYSKRYIQILSMKDNFDRYILKFHFAVNGFGEIFLRPLINLIIIIFFGILLLTPNTDFIATKATPLFLLRDYNISNNHTLTIKNTEYIYITDLNKSQRLFNQIQKDKDHYTIVVPSLKESSINRVIFVLSRFVNIITPANKNWYKPKGHHGYFMSSFLSIISWLFLGAFILALRNRIRRN